MPVVDDRAGYDWRTSRLWQRLARVASEEVLQLSPKKLLAETASALLPQGSFSRTRTAILRMAGVKIGPHSLVLNSIRVTGLKNSCERLTIGRSTIVTGPLHVDLGAPIKIGDGVRIGHDVSLLTISHAIGVEALRCGEIESGPIEIGDGAWIASRVTVLSNVSIGAGAVVAAGAVVSRDVAPNTLVAGVPARFVRNLAVSD